MAVIRPAAGLLALLPTLLASQASSQGLTGPAGLRCWDLDEDRTCDLASEDSDGDGSCSTADCSPGLQCAGSDCLLAGRLTVHGDLSASGSLSSGGNLLAAQREVGDALLGLANRLPSLEADPASGSAVSALEGRVDALEVDPATGTQLGGLGARIDILEADATTGAALGALGARLGALEADPATAAEVGALDARVRATEFDPTTGAELATLDQRLLDLEADPASNAQLVDFEDRLLAMELDFAAASALLMLQARVAAAEGAMAVEPAGLHTRLTAVEAQRASRAALGSVEGRLVSVEADFATQTALQALDDEAAHAIYGDITWTTPGDFPHVEDAVAEARNWRVAPNAQLTIEVLGTHVMSGPLDLSHPDGSQLRLVGGSAAAGSDVLEFHGSGGLVVERSNFRWVDRLTLRGDGSEDTEGVSVQWAGGLGLGPEVVVEDFDTGLRVGEGAQLYARGVTVRDAANSCFLALQGSHLDVVDAVGSGCGDGLRAFDNSVGYAASASIEASRYGFYASGSGAIEASETSVVAEQGCHFADDSGFIRANSGSCAMATAGGDGDGDAVRATQGSTIVVTAAQVASELGEALYAADGSTIIAWGGTTLSGDGPRLVRASASSVVRAAEAELSGSAAVGGTAVHQSYVDLFDVTGSYTNEVDASSMLRQ